MELYKTHDLDPAYQKNMFYREYERYADEKVPPIDADLRNEFEHYNYGTVREQFNDFLKLPFMCEDVFWATRELIRYSTEQIVLSGHTDVRFSGQYLKAWVLLAALWIINGSWVIAAGIPGWGLSLMIVCSYILLSLLLRHSIVEVSQSQQAALVKNDAYSYALELMDEYGKNHFDPQHNEYRNTQ